MSLIEATLAAAAKNIDNLRKQVRSLVGSVGSLTTAQAQIESDVAHVRTLAENTAKQQGPQGPKGDTGPRGLPGKDGKDGKNGADGKDGREGRDGKDGATGPAPDHQWKGTKLRFQDPSGDWGKWVDLQGPKGETGNGGGGTVVVAGQGTGPAWNPDDLPLANADTPTEFVVKQDGIWVRATYGQMTDWFGSAASGATTLDGGMASSQFREIDLFDGGTANG